MADTSGETKQPPVPQNNFSNSSNSSDSSSSKRRRHRAKMAHPRFDNEVAEHQGNAAMYVQIATPKSPNSDGFSPEDHQETPLEHEVKRSLLNEVDLEILLKHREYNLVQNEIARVQAQLSLMENLHDDPRYAVFIEELIKLERAAKLAKEAGIIAQALNGTAVERPQTTGAQNYNLRKTSSHHEQQQHRTSYGGLRPIMDANGNKVCVHKRSDGVIVRVDCPKCGRTDFGSAQGFLNHARLAHSIEYKSQEDAALQCGSLMPESDQDEIGVSSIRKLKELGLNADNTLCPGVCIEDPVKKRRRLSSKSDSTKTSHLEKLYGVNHSTEGFKTLVEDVTHREEVEEEESEQTDPEEQQKKQLFKKSHNRRKSRGGLSAVKFDDKVETFREVSPNDTTNVVVSQVLKIESNTPPMQSSSMPSSSGSILSSASFPGANAIRLTKCVDDSLSAAQRRRIPSVSEPLRTRSRSSRENSH